MSFFEIVVNEDGSVVLETKGFVGPACLAEAERLIKLLREVGLEVKTENIQLTEEYHGKERQRVRV